jgi:hypothetical protein
VAGAAAGSRPTYLEKDRELRGGWAWPDTHPRTVGTHLRKAGLSCGTFLPVWAPLSVRYLHWGKLSYSATSQGGETAPSMSLNLDNKCHSNPKDLGANILLASQGFSHSSPAFPRQRMAKLSTEHYYVACTSEGWLCTGSHPSSS